MVSMTLHGLIPLLRDNEHYQQLCAEIEAGAAAPGDTPLALNLFGGARPYVATALAESLNRPVLIIAARPEVAQQIQEQMTLFLPDAATRLWLYPDPGALPYERVAWSAERVQQRLTVLNILTQPNRNPIIITSARAVLYPTLPRPTFTLLQRALKAGQSVSLRVLLATLYAMGYVNVNTVLEPGQFAQRGGILDVFPANRLTPMRIEFWGDEIDSIRAFDPISQRSQETISEMSIPPASEAILQRNGAKAAEQLQSLDFSRLNPVMQQTFAEDIARLAANERFEEIEFYLPYLYDKPGNFFDYLPSNTLTLIDDWTALEVNVDDVEAEALQQRMDLNMRGDLPANFATVLHTWDDLQDHFSQHPPIVLGYGENDPFGLGEQFLAGQRFGGRLPEAIRTIGENFRNSTQILYTRQAERMAELLRNEGLPNTVQPALPTEPKIGNIILLNGSLPEGFVFNTDGKPLRLITDAELFGWSRTAARKPLRPRKRATAETFFSEIKTGDYVVHTDHGIGQYLGLVQREINGVVREYLELEYAQGDKLYVPVHQADRVARYIGTGEKEPSVHRLGTADWDTARKRAKKAVEDIADELLDLYAARATVQGHAFGPDTPWQAEMEAAFPYTETEDQLRAIEEVKGDMEATAPMDRLVVGDVGFGKTEVALRAAFKAIMEGKQVAVLVPTTVLAQQHFNTFSQRLAPYPVKVEMLSRFRTDKEQNAIIAQLEAGEVDMVVGTHRLLSQDVVFKDLGLLVIDEEQRFGVTHKERLKQFRKEVDVLTLTATPIPRTLHMALMGARDMSTINTPPEERLPVVTKVAEWDDHLVRRAILLELDRGGQVFFVHNRVMSIYAMAQRLGILVPEAQITVAHGQMNEHELEQAMLDFANGVYDVLVCTSIIESGLDLPNVNTIILDRADMFGLAQLYQLRGRVGRGARRGYGYFIHPRATQMTLDALERLEVMQEATELGAGFRVALRDMEIRGAGDLLGARQSGHIAAVGFDMYAKLLGQAVRERREAREVPNIQTKRARQEIVMPGLPPVDLPLQAHLPPDYISDDDTRLQIYRRMAEVTTLQQVEELENELRDRFGKLVESAANLLYILRLRILAAAVGVTQIALDPDSGNIAILFPGPGPVHLLLESRLLAGRVKFGRRDVQLARIGGASGWQPELENILLTLAAETNVVA
jgi:transcription-repair coupling factor (superfamily II helicase)